MALKFLNKKGWHTGSLRNIENVWKAEQKHDAEQKKLEELRKQIHEERERSEFRQLQEQAGLVPRQERLEFLYDSGLAVGKTSEGGSFKALEAATPKPSADAAVESSSKQAAAAAAPGALFEEKPQSANDTWRKLHSDPLLMIRQREQEALARVKNNPVQMAMIRKSIESKSKKEKDKDGDKKERKAKGRDKKEHKSHDKRERREKRHHTSSKHQKHSSSRQQSDSDNDTDEDIKGRKSGNRTEDYDKHYHKRHADSGSELSERDDRSNKSQYKRLKDEEQSPKGRSDSRTRKDDDQDSIRKNHDKSKHDRYSSKDRIDIDDSGKERENKRFHDSRSHNSSATGLQHEARRKQRYVAPKLSEEERAARLREMQMDAEVHEEQRWKRLKKAEDDDAREASLAKVSGGRNFLDAAHRSVYGAEKGGSSTIEESVRRRTHYRQGRSEASEGNAFRR